MKNPNTFNDLEQKVEINFMEKIRAAAGKVIAIPAVIAAGAGLYTAPLHAEGNKTISFGSNQLQNSAMVEEKKGRDRLINNIEISLGDVVVAYHGLNEVTWSDEPNYFGRNWFMIGGKDNKFVVDVRATSQGILYTMTGLRNSSLPKKLGATYGFAEIAQSMHMNACQEAILNVTALYGKPLGKGISAELFQSSDISFHDKDRHYTEGALMYDITPTCQVFVRVEMLKFDKVQFEKPTYVVGFTLHNNPGK
jgi:hypothetical protein